MNINIRIKHDIARKFKSMSQYTIVLGVLSLVSSVVQAGDLTPEQELGKRLYQDTNLSLEKNQSCASCHSVGTVDLFGGKKTSAAGFVDPENVASGSPTSRGSVAGNFGGLNSPSAAYAAFSPDFYFDMAEGLWIGGQFWNGRAATLEEQAKGPFLNPLEMAMPSKWAVISQIKNNGAYDNVDYDYVTAFRDVYGFDLDRIRSSKSKKKVKDAYNLVADAIASFERSRIFNAFTSKFDFVEAGVTNYTARERKGKELFEGKAKCVLCHVMDDAEGPDGHMYPPVFTDFTYDNIGVPRNTSIPGNPSPDIGLGATTGDPGDNGKHKVMSLRNIAVTGPYAHNGYFSTLEEIVHFYNTRDVASEGWASPEVSNNVNGEELGDLDLTEEEEADVVAFLKTLTDDYPAWGMDTNVPKGTPSPW